VLEDLLYDVLILDEGKDAHLPVAPRADEGSTSNIFWMSLAQVYLHSLNDLPVRGWRVSYRPSHSFSVRLALVYLLFRGVAYLT